MISNRFRSVAKILAAHIHDTYDMLNAADAIVDYVESEIAAALTVPSVTLVELARHYTPVKDAIKIDRKVQAIKVLKDLTGCTLKECKEAVETAYDTQSPHDSDAALQALREKLMG